MTYRKTFFSLMLCFISAWGYAQKPCSSIELIKARGANSDHGEVELQIVSNGTFNGKVINVTDSGEKVVNIFSGAGNQKIVVSNLYSTLRYNIVVEFENEQKFLCKTKVLPDIFSTDKLSK